MIDCVRCVALLEAALTRSGALVQSPLSRVSSSDTTGGEDKFDAVVIGSGFGGAVAAWRLQRSCPGKRILVLERGMPYPPGSFARTPHEMRRNFWDPSAWLYGLYELWSFEHSKVLVSSGLGGGSLIYANVLLEKPSDTFGADRSNGGRPWPLSHEQVARHYQEVRDRLGASVLPDEYFNEPEAGSASVPKTKAFLDAALAAGLPEAERAKLAVTFAASGREPEPGAPLGLRDSNLHHRERHSCTLVGECDLGCNEGAKNSLDYTYLSLFSDAGGRIRTCCEAVALSAARDGYRIRYVQHLEARARVEARARADRKARDSELLDPVADQIREITAGVVVLAAGTLGSTRLLLASRTGLPPLSPQLGRRFSSNGDLLSFARNCTDKAGNPRELSPSRGPVITAYATGGAAGKDVWMEDAGGPGLSEWGWQLPELAGDLWAMRGTALRMLRKRWRGRVSRDLAAALGSARASSAMLPMLTMGRDVPGGTIRLEGDSLALDWNPSGDSAEYFERAEAAAAKIARQLGGELGPALLRRRTRGVSVHPLGGCPMAERAREGVVGPDGEVFGCPNLFVADGSVLPGPVGPNPSLTIAATAHHIAEAAARRLSAAPIPVEAPPPGAP
jgi:cholesterol oxidase